MISVFAGLPDNKITKRYRVVPGKSIQAEHGLSYYHRFSLRPGTTEAADLGQLKKEEIESLGLKVFEAIVQ